MSVAFRRESDEEHLEPRPDLPIPPGPNLVTAAGLAAIEQRAATLELDLDAALAVPAEDAVVKAIRRDLRYWQTQRATARVTAALDDETVGFGTRVTYRRADGDRHVVTLVGHDEADPAAGSIAFTAPLARALMGAGIDDRVQFRSGGETVELEILDVQPIAD